MSFRIRLAVLTSNGGYRRPFDHDVSSGVATRGCGTGYPSCRSVPINHVWR